MSAYSRPRADGGKPGISRETPAVSVVIPLRHERFRAALQGLGHSYEIVYVDDGSRDGTFQLFTGIVHADARGAGRSQSDPAGGWEGADRG